MTQMKGSISVRILSYSKHNSKKLGTGQENKISCKAERFENKEIRTSYQNWQTIKENWMRRILFKTS